MSAPEGLFGTECPVMGIDPETGDPTYFKCENPNCEYCDGARLAVLKAKRIQLIKDLYIRAHMAMKYARIYRIQEGKQGEREGECLKRVREIRGRITEERK